MNLKRGTPMNRQTDLAYDYIKTRIIEGSYKPSQKLVESDLSEIIGVSRNTIKKALLTLQSENLVEIESNKGAIVKSFTLEEVIHYLEIREALEGLVAQKAAKNLVDADITKLEEILNNMARCLENNKFDEYSSLNRTFHEIIYNASGNAEAVELIMIIKTQLIRFHFRTILVPGRNQESFKEHEQIIEALRSRNEREAEEMLKKHIANVRRTIEENYNYLI